MYDHLIIYLKPEAKQIKYLLNILHDINGNKIQLYAYMYKSKSK